MKALSLLSAAAAALVPAVVKAADNEGCAACKTANKAYCYYKAGTGGESVVGVCVENTARADTDCPDLTSLSAMYASITENSEFSKVIQYDATMNCGEETVGSGVLLPMAADVTKEKIEQTFEECMTASLAWCNYEPKDKTAGGYCGADASQDCPKLAKFGGIELTPSSGGKAVTTSACTDCTTEFCGYLNGNTVAYAVCLPEAVPPRTACPAFTSMNAMYESIGVAATDLTSTFVKQDNHASGCGTFSNLSGDLVMSVKNHLNEEVFEKETCDDCVKTVDPLTLMESLWCNYVPTKAKTTGDEKEGGYCGANKSCVKLENANQYEFTVSEPLTTCPSATSTKAPSAAYPTAIVSTSFVMATSLVGFACM